MKYVRKLIVVPAERFEEMQTKLNRIEHEELPFDYASRQGKGAHNPVYMPETGDNNITANNSETTVIGEYPNSDAKPSLPKKLEIDAIASTVGKAHRHKAKELLKYIKQTGPNILSWKHNGEIMFHGKPVARSNIIDLVRNLMAKTPKSYSVYGQNEFESVLRELNVPLSLINNPKIRKNIQSLSMDDDNHASSPIESNLGNQGNGSKGKETEKKAKWISL